MAREGRKKDGKKDRTKEERYEIDFTGEISPRKRREVTQTSLKQAHMEWVTYRPQQA